MTSSHGKRRSAKPVWGAHFRAKGHQRRIKMGEEIHLQDEGTEVLGQQVEHQIVAQPLQGVVVRVLQGGPDL